MEPLRSGLSVGDVLDGKYQLEHVVGSGAMGTVYRARHLELGTVRAVKLMKADLASDPCFVERFQREAHVLEKVRHPHLVALHDFCRLPSGVCYIVSEYVDGRTLAELLGRPERWPAAEIGDLFGQIADGLAAAHRVGIVHRDVSPDNLMVVTTPSGPRAKVLDFGLAKDVLRGAPGLTGGGLLLGKIGYASPEQMGLLPDGESVDARSDVFSLVAVLYRFVCGRLPWRCDSLQSYLHDLIVRPEAELHARIEAEAPRPWRALFRTALSRDSARRPPSMADLKRQMAAAASGATPSIIARRIRRRRRRVAAWAALLLAAGVATPFISGQRRAKRPWAAVPAGRTAPPGARPQMDAPPPATAAVVLPAATRLTGASNAHSERSPEGPPAPRRHDTAAPAREPSSVGPPAELAAPGAEGRLVLSAAPAASVLLDGAFRGHTPMTLGIAAGVHRLRLTSADGQSVDEIIEVLAGATVERNHRFPGFGGLSIAAEPWMEVRVDGGPPEQTPVFLPRVAAGLHVVTAQRAGYEPITAEVDVQPGRTHNVGLAPRPVAAARSDR